MATESAPLDFRILRNEEGRARPEGGCGGWSPPAACAKLSALTCSWVPGLGPVEHSERETSIEALAPVEP